MSSQIECSCESDGRWVAKIHALPGLQIFECTQDEALSAARTLSALLHCDRDKEDQRILAFYPGSIPNSAPFAR